MKRTAAFCTLTFFILSSTFAQSSTPLPNPKPAEGADPQFALSLLGDYFEKDERDDRTGGVVLTATGGVLLAAGLAGLGYSFVPPSAGALYSDASGQMLVRGLSIGTSGAGLVLGGIGIGLLAKPDDAYKQEYAYLFAERDPVVQEAIAYGIMKELADNAKRQRLVGGLVNISMPLAAAGGHAIAAAATSDWTDFHSRVLGTMSWTLPSLVSGIIMLSSGKSEEERMLDSYRAMSASYSSRRGK